MSQLDADLQEDMQLLHIISVKFSNNVRKNVELSNLVNQMSQVNETLKDDGSKLNNQIADLRNICENQTNFIADQHLFEKQNAVLQKNNEELKRVISTLQQNLVDISQAHTKQFQQQIKIHNDEVELLKEENCNIESKWRETIEICEINSEAIKNDNKNEIKKISEEWAEKLKSSELSQHQLKQENNQNEVTIAVLNKKVLELEQKLKKMEREKLLYGPSHDGFISSSNVLNNNPTTFNNSTTGVSSYKNNSNVVPTKPNNSTTDVSSYKNNLERPANQIKATLTETTKMVQYTKKFNFRNNLPNEKTNTQVLHHVELRRQMLSSSQNWTTLPVGLQNNNLKFHTNESFSQNNLYQSDNNNTTAAIKPNNSAKVDTSVVNKNIPNNKRKRLFDPNNLDYLDSTNF